MLLYSDGNEWRKGYWQWCCCQNCITSMMESLFVRKGGIYSLWAVCRGGGIFVCKRKESRSIILRLLVADKIEHSVFYDRKTRFYEVCSGMELKRYSVVRGTASCERGST